MVLKVPNCQLAIDMAANTMATSGDDLYDRVMWSLLLPDVHACGIRTEHAEDASGRACSRACNAFICTQTLYLTKSLQDLASSNRDMSVIAATRITLYGADTDVFHR